MAWSISISAEGWQDIYEACYACEKQFLWDALNESLNQNGKPVLHGSLFDKLGQDTLAEEVYQTIILTNTCDNGSFSYWIDPKGYYKVTPSALS